MWMLKIALGLAVMGGSAYAAVWLYHSPPGRAWRRFLAIFDPDIEDDWLLIFFVTAILALLCTVVVGGVLWAAYAIGGIIL